VSTSAFPVLDVFSVNVPPIESNSLSILISMKETETNKTAETFGLIDSGARGKFIDQNYAKWKGFEIKTLQEPITARNVDGTENKQGKITSYVDLTLTINGRTTPTHLLVSKLGKQKIILGFPWLKQHCQHNPIIDWVTKEVTWRTETIKPKRRLIIKRYHDVRKIPPKPTITNEPDREEHLNQTQNPTVNNEILLAYLEEVQKPNEIWINTKTTSAIEFHLKHDERKEELPLPQQIPAIYHDYLDVFDKDKADRFPSSRPWDHKIELKEGFEPKSFKTYNLTPEEQKELDVWIKRKISTRATFDHRNHQWHHRSSM
jgi:Retroviral aspartyl protease